MNLGVLLWGIPQAMRAAARLYPEYAARLRERDLVAQITMRDEPDVGRWIELEAGKVRTGKGLHAKPDVTIAFKNAALAKSFLTSWLSSKKSLVVMPLGFRFLRIPRTPASSTTRGSGLM